MRHATKEEATAALALIREALKSEGARGGRANVERSPEQAVAARPCTTAMCHTKTAVPGDVDLEQAAR